MNKTARKIIIALSVLVGILLLLTGIAWLYRDTILQQLITKAQTKFETKYDCQLKIKKARFIDNSSLEFNEILVIPNQLDTLVSVEKVKTKINFWQVLSGNIQIQDLEIKNGFIQLVKDKRGKNFDAFLKKDKSSNDDSSTNYAEKYNHLLEKLLNLVPAEMSLDQVALRIKDYDKKIDFYLSGLELKDHKIQTTVQVTEEASIQHWRIEGLANPREKQANINLASIDTSAIQLPYIEKRFGLKSGFKTIHFELKNLAMEGGELHIDGRASIENFMVNHPKIAKKDVIIPQALFDYHFLIGKHFISLNNTSVATLNALKIKPYLEYNTEEDTLYKLKIDIPDSKAQEFIDALPKGLFRHFEGMQAEGSFSYNLNFEFNKNKPYRLVFDSRLNKNNLRITKYGEANLDKLNHEFTYRAIENDVPQRPVLVGMTNLNYTPLDMIPGGLKNAVLTSEDPSFMRHRGFITEAFKQSIVKNIRTKKFSRGASTISMQLVKNVFLTREKTLSRKLEEILLVYILENNRIATKERMLEVYFNVIEWGPNVYGIGEAAAFYFNKKPIELNLNECLYLASIVPKPKKFMWQFDNEGNQKSYATKHQLFIKNLMLRRALLVPEDTIGQSLPLQITGRARSYLKIKIPKDSIAKDSILTEFGEEN